MLTSEKHWKEMQAFLRIANARLKSIYRFGPQRRAVIAKMYSRWLERKQDDTKRKS